MSRYKHCPFCRASNVTGRVGYQDITFFQCLNPKCGAVVSFGATPKLDHYEAIVRWNRREEPQLPVLDYEAGHTMAIHPILDPPHDCRQRLQLEGKPYPRSSCYSCGQLSPKWRECEAKLKVEHARGKTS